MKFTFFWDGPFSQWHESPMVIDSKEYNCCEQYMMYRKASLFGDTISAKKIMLTDYPWEQKRLGRLVRPFDDSIWMEIAEDVVYKGNYAKFTQNKDLLQYLLDTEGTTIVEASPFDHRWGIGLSEEKAKVTDPDKWPGQNLLGKVLTKLRDNILNKVE